MAVIRAGVRLASQELPEGVGGILYKDSSVEVQCTPVWAVPSVDKGLVCGVFGGEKPKPVFVCVFGIVDGVLCFEDGGEDESAARLTVSLRSGLGQGDRCEATFYGGQALACAPLCAPAVCLVISSGVLKWLGGRAVVQVGSRTVVAAAADACLVAAEAAGRAAKERFDVASTFKSDWRSTGPANPSRLGKHEERRDDLKLPPTYDQVKHPRVS